MLWILKLGFSFSNNRNLKDFKRLYFHIQVPGLAVKRKLVNTRILRLNFQKVLCNLIFKRLETWNPIYFSITNLKFLDFFLFSGTRVFVARVGRQTKTREYKDLEAHFTAHLGYSHHQKAVIVDAPIDHQPSYCDSTAGEERLKPG